jgi:uncharacterized repeat protein (TIGR01451 family)
MTLDRKPRLFRRKLAAPATLAALAAALFVPGCQNDEAEQMTRADGGRDYRNVNWQIDQQPSADGRSSEYVITIPGPRGEGALRLERDQPRRIRAGEPLQYDIAVTNISNTPLHNIVIEEWRGGGMRVEDSFVHPQGERDRRRQVRADGEARQMARVNYQQDQPRNQQEDRQRQTRGDEQGDAASTGHSRWRMAALMPGESKTITVEAMAPREGEIRTCMAVSYEPTICMTTQVVEPSLRLVREMGQEMAYICDEVKVTYLIENTGSAVARNVRLQEQLPEGLMLADGQRQAMLNIGSIPPGETMERTVRVRARQPGQYSSFALAGNDSLRARSRKQSIRFVEPELDLMLDAPAAEYVGRDVPLRLTLTNMSDVPAFETAVRLEGVSQLSQLSLSTQEVEMEGDVIDVGRLDPGETREMTLTFRAEETGAMSMTADAQAYCAQSVSDAVTIDLQGIAAVRLEAVDLVDPVVVGEESVYEVRVKNQGSATSINVGVTAILPEEMTFIRGEGDSRVTAEGQQVNLAPIERLAPGDIVTWRIYARAEQPGKTQLQLRLQSNAMRKPAHEQEPTTIVRQAASPQRDN